MTKNRGNKFVFTYLSRMFTKDRKMDGEILNYANAGRKLVGRYHLLGEMNVERANFCLVSSVEMRLGYVGQKYTSNLNVAGIGNVKNSEWRIKK